MSHDTPNPPTENRWLALPLLAALLTSLPLLLRPLAVLPTDSFRAHAWLEAAKYRWHARHVILNEGSFPLWNPFLEGGFPAYSHPVDGTLSPFFLTSLLLGTLPGMKVDAVLLLLAGTAGVHGLARRWLRLPGSAAAAAALCFAVSGWVPSRLALGFYESLFLCVSPLALLGLLETLRAKTLREASGPALGTALLVAAAGIQLQLCLAFLFVQLLLWAMLAGRTEAGSLRISVGWVVGLAATVALLGACKFLPMIDLLESKGWRIENPPHAASLLSGVLEPLLQLVETANASGRYAPTGLPIDGEGECGGLPGVTLLFAALGLVAAPRRSGVVAILFAVTASLGWSAGQGTQLSLFELLHPLPVFSSFRNTGTSVSFFLVLWACLGAGLGFAWLARSLQSPRQQALLWATLLTLLAGPAMESVRLYDEIFHHKVPSAPSEQPAFQQVELVGFPATGTQDVALFTYLAPQAGVGVLYEPEDLPDRQVAPLQPAWRLQTDGSREENPDYRAEAWSLSDPVELGPLEVSANRLAITARAPAGTTVVLNQNFHPDWTTPEGVALLDSRGRLGIRFERPYNGPVVLHFKPRRFYLGLATSLTTLALLLLGTSWLRRRDPPDRAPAQETTPIDR